MPHDPYGAEIKIGSGRLSVPRTYAEKKKGNRNSCLFNPEHQFVAVPNLQWLPL